ncbi:IclR family acetate operon transcriptional repressor [Streptomonospora nanhaiensis]|uniref:Glycerol operon regulatory protein n=1 Tax=Streptomonospora nanhaiensis TaxID=1323731 RepID=A0A853BL77_9ACTN|nr:IclR family transcriptional regulator [Streptomonospora nanhaiensis]NYI95417.1 IclR family acetate operon transcriptional repressor [Streptomonospora nanhaiensis]
MATPSAAADAADTPAKARGGGVQSLDRAFALLEIMADAGGEISLSQLAESSGLPLPTIHRIIRTLVGKGYVRQLPSRRYALGPRLIGLGDSASRMLGTWARPHLTHLVEELGETANLAMLDGDKVVYVAQVPSQHAMRMFTEVGRRVPAHSAGVGKALLAQLPDREAMAVLHRAGMPAATDRTITTPDAFAAEITRIRERGYAIDDGEQEVGVRCLAVPVRGGPAMMAVSISGPEARVSWEFVTRAAPIVQRAAAELAADLDHRE